MHLTDRDIDMLTWLTQLQCATYDQLAVLTGTSVGALRRRLPRLQEQALVHRVDARRADRPIALWFATARGAAKTKTRIDPAHPESVDFVRAFTLADIALRHRHKGDRLLAGRQVAAKLENAALMYAMRAPKPIARLPRPDLLLERGNHLVAVELRLGEAAVDDWHQLLLDYDRLGVHKLLLFTDSLALKACLGSPGAYAAQVFVTVHLLDDEPHPHEATSITDTSTAAVR